MDTLTTITTASSSIWLVRHCVVAALIGLVTFNLELLTSSWVTWYVTLDTENLPANVVFLVFFPCRLEHEADYGGHRDRFIGIKGLIHTAAKAGP